MVVKNLLRRKGRTALTVLGISIGVTSIIALGALADGLEAGYGSVLSGSQADLILSDPDSFDLILSSVDQTIGDELLAMPEVAEVSGLLQGLVMTESSPYFFVFGYPEGSFALERFQIVEGIGLYSREAAHVRGKPLILGSAAAESFSKQVGDSLRVGDSVYRVVGIYETGEAFEEAGAVLQLQDAQELLGKQRQVSAFYIKLKDPAMGERLKMRIERLHPDLSLSTPEDMTGQLYMADSLRAMVWGIAAMAILIGGVSMTNAQLMSIIERTREIGVLRAVGWRSRRVLLMILGESVSVGLLGGILGTIMAWLMLLAFSGPLSTFGATTNPSPALLAQAFVVVLLLGIVGGLYPAYRAAKLQPIEAIRYEGGTLGKEANRLPVGGMAFQNLWRRKTRTLLTLGVIGLTIGAILSVDALLGGAADMLNDFVGGAEIMVRQAGAADTGVAFIDELVGDQIGALSEVKNVSGILFTAIMSDDLGIVILMGFAPREAAIQQFRIVEGERITTNHQIMIGRQMADAQNIGVGDTVTLSNVRFRVVGIYEHGVSAYEMGGVITLRDAQNFTGHARKVTFFSINLHDPKQARATAEKINTRFPEVKASLAGEFAEQLPDMQSSAVMSDGIAMITVMVGGVGVMNTMLMTVLERTREIGTLRALGWRRRAILSLILREALSLGLVGGIVGAAVAFGLAWLSKGIPGYGEMLPFSWRVEYFIRALGIALSLGLIGGLYPAFRATRLQPVEALQYE